MKSDADRSKLSRQTFEKSFGADVLQDETVRFRLFGPAAKHAQLVLSDRELILDMMSTGDGWHELTTDRAGVGSRYLFQLPSGKQVPDPASRFQPDGARHGSQVIDPSHFQWSDDAWRGHAWEMSVLYELHVGTFTSDGTFRAAIDKLEHLHELGINTVEIMCVAEFAGRWSWGYDPLLLFAPSSNYGTPDDMRAFVDAAHRIGISVMLDVVYNHFGAEGNFLPLYFPDIYSSRYETPWGKSLNFDGPDSKVVREFIIGNAFYWIHEFHIDGLRLDASHTMVDESPMPILDELAQRIHHLELSRPIHLVLEHEIPIPDRVGRNLSGAIHSYTAQWNYDFQNILTAVYGDFCKPEFADKTRTTALAVGEGYTVPLRNSGSLPVYLAPPTSSVCFIQTHDLVGNRIQGERMIMRGGPDQMLRALASIYLLCPQIPMIFMGEEWGASTPFPYFADQSDEIVQQLVKHRQHQFAEMRPEPDRRQVASAPGVADESTFVSAHLDWNELALPKNSGWVSFYKELIALRKARIIPFLSNLVVLHSTVEIVGPGAFACAWNLDRGAHLYLAANLCSGTRANFPTQPGEEIWLSGASPDQHTLGPWAVRWKQQTRTQDESAEMQQKHPPINRFGLD